ncbi:hypothetical protein DFH08DRAFT_960746 [Mycena albidolilacea]|uniref:Uncharacterized protein n=1 Tax=Mycena albidolilacea TaxID=1033008 RepID=A0AAD7A198_9AGAR|nr:hypothetical protein DFH08DRAFT_960746 [Mycena albidolilacea]
MRHVEETCDPQLDHALSEVASALVTSLGLDPNTASVADMDHRNARFRCDGRVAYDACGKYNKDIKVFTWRGCITHAIETHYYGSQEETPSYRTLDADYYHKVGTVSFVVIPAPRRRIPGPVQLRLAQSRLDVLGVRALHEIRLCTADLPSRQRPHVEPHPGTSDVLFAPGVLCWKYGCHGSARDTIGVVSLARVE